MIPQTHRLGGDAPWSEPNNEVSYLSQQPLNDSTGHEPNWIALFGAGFLFFFLGIALVQESAAVGILFIFIGLATASASYAAWQADAREEAAEVEAALYEWDQADSTSSGEYSELARSEARKKEIDEIVKAVKSTIKIRCRYCGTLNEEKESKCESCGANL